MASFLERAIIQRDAQLSPFSVDFVPPTDTTLAAVQEAVDFKRRIKSAVEDQAHEIIANPPPAGTTGAENDKLIWAQKVAVGERRDADTILRLILAEFDDVTPPQLAGVTDQQIQEYVGRAVPVLARGIRK